jgi:hypothetical protein
VLPPALENLPVSATDVQRAPVIKSAWQPRRGIQLPDVPQFIFALVLSQRTHDYGPGIQSKARAQCFKCALFGAPKQSY